LYVADAKRACDEVGAAQANQQLSDADRCKLVTQFCRIAKEFQKLANTPENLSGVSVCNPPIPNTGTKIVQDCNCNTADCPVSSHQFP